MIPLLYSMMPSAMSEESDAETFFPIEPQRSVEGSEKSLLAKASTTTDEPRLFFS